jgi:tRNA U34 5-methylaminomethyl-2-thiouridine-forming methyltransferase MnmC
MKRIITEDGSHTLQSEQINDTYHSTHGAVTEAEMVYIINGLDFAVQRFKSSINLLEIGFGTGLNAFLSCRYASANRSPVVYYSLEPFPISNDDICALNYGTMLHDEDLFTSIHQAPWNKPIEITPFFTLIKIQETLQNIDFGCSQFHLVFFDAFGPEKQPELWSESNFQKIGLSLFAEGVLTTYSTKGDVKRALKKAGFKLEKLPGPPGKREVLRATLTHFYSSMSTLCK